MDEYTNKKKIPCNIDNDLGQALNRAVKEREKVEGATKSTTMMMSMSNVMMWFNKVLKRLMWCVKKSNIKNKCLEMEKTTNERNTMYRNNNCKVFSHFRSLFDKPDLMVGCVIAITFFITLLFFNWNYVRSDGVMIVYLYDGMTTRWLTRINTLK